MTDDCVTCGAPVYVGQLYRTRAPNRVVHVHCAGCRGPARHSHVVSEPMTGIIRPEPARRPCCAACCALVVMLPARARARPPAPPPLAAPTRSAADRLVAELDARLRADGRGVMSPSATAPRAIGPAGRRLARQEQTP